VSGPDPLSAAMEPNAAQRAYMDMAGETGAKYPGWQVTWDLQGFWARRGLVRLGPASTQGALEALLDSFPRRPAAPAGACTATWEPGAEQLTVACPHGRTWAHEAFPLGHRPLPHFFHGLPWMPPPGSQWEQDDDEGVWRVAVVPVSAEIAGELFAIRKSELRSFG
jgi:hypothetical protein